MVSLEIGEGLSADFVSLSRSVTRRSNEKLSDGSRINSKQNLKLSVGQRAVYNISRNATSASKPISSKLDQFLNTDC